MKHNEKKIKKNEQKNAAWFLKQGYLSPEEMIDHDDNLDHIESFIQIFAAYNQHNIASGAAWDTWPDWELCLTTMDADLHFEDPKRDPPETIALRQHWLAAMQFIHDHEAVSYEGYTITIQGKHGHTFAFDFCLEIEAWGAPGTYADYKARIEANAKKPKAWMWRRESYVFEGHIGHSLGPWWVCPEYVPKYGGMNTNYTPDSSFCFSGDEGTFPPNLLCAIQLCIDDLHIWEIQYKEAEGTAAYYDEILKEYPSGRPEDHHYL